MISGLLSVAFFLLSVFFVFGLIIMARRMGWYDQHDERKIHDGQIPRLGGVGFASAYIILAAGLSISGITHSLGARIIPVLVAMPLVLIFGVVDDFHPLRPRHKLLVQSIASVLVMAAGYSFDHLTFAPLGLDVDFGWFRFPLTFLWLVGVTNAINLIDGVDGLAGGVSALIALSFALIFSAKGNAGSALLSVTLAASIGGFLVFNAPLPKAKIFMGDGGSQFLGFTLALMPILDSGERGTNLSLPFAAALLLIPIFDTFSAIWRRLRDGRRIDSPDRAHMHHKLMNLGFDARGVDAVVYSLQIALGVLVYYSATETGLQPLFFLSAAYALGAAFFVSIHYINRAAMKTRESSDSVQKT